MSPSISSAEYQEMLDSGDVSPMFHAEFERLRRAALRREELHARISITAREHARITKWQQETLRVFHQFLAKQFEVLAWESRERKPRLWVEARNALELKRSGVQQRLARLRREVAEGCPLQAEWLALHAELINAVERESDGPSS